jgi:phosphate:Na+ symporter
MKDGFDTFGQTINLADYMMTGYPGILVFVCIGVAATVVMQSSHATLILILTALAAQQISYENGLALAIGSNIGTTVTAIIGSLGSNTDGKRLALAHLIFNVVTALIAIAGIYQLMIAVEWLSTRIGIAADNYTLQLALFHSLFNVMGIVVMLPLMQPLVRFLEKVVVAEQAAIERPKYLSNASLEIRDAAVEAVKKESVRLYDLATSVITDGLSIQRDALESEKKLKYVLRASTDVIDEDIDDLYERKLKALYGAIVEYVIRSRGGYSEGRMKEELSGIRQAGQHVIEAVKGVKHLRKNLIKSLQSDDPTIRKEYDRLRKLILKMMRDIEVVRTTGAGSASVLPLDRLKLEIEEKTRQFSEGLDTLIRNEQINVYAATSLMNDISYCRDICWDLVEAGSVLFSQSLPGERDAMRSIALGEHEIVEMMTDADERAS